jgi:hypothetical protein
VGQICIRRKEPYLGPNPDYSKAFYYDPPSHDFIVWLVIAELMRRHHKSAGPLQVLFGFIEGMLGKYDFGPFALLSGSAWVGSNSLEYSDTMLANVLRPAMEMIGAVEGRSFYSPFDQDEVADLVEYDHHISLLVDAAKQGHEIPKFTPPAWAFAEVDAYLRGKKPVVITLRETTVQPQRNSNLGEWLKFADSISDEHEVLFVRDTAKADESFQRLAWRRPAKNAYVRAALYQRALCNLMVCTGPVNWCNFSDAPVLIFKQLVPALPTWDGGQPIGWRKQCHLEVGEQLPWASPLQRLTWKDDTFEHIREEFEGFMEIQRAHAICA